MYEYSELSIKNFEQCKDKGLDQVEVSVNEIDFESNRDV